MDTTRPYVRAAIRLVVCAGTPSGIFDYVTLMCELQTYSSICHILCLLDSSYETHCDKILFPTPFDQSLFCDVVGTDLACL